ncbi:unnamed protein product [Durusdinium trenchii]
MVPGAPCLFNIIRLKQNRHLISHEDISGHLHSNGKNTFANGRPYRVVHGRGTLAGEALLNEDQAVEICHSLLQRQPTRSIGSLSSTTTTAMRSFRWRQTGVQPLQTHRDGDHVKDWLGAALRGMARDVRRTVMTRKGRRQF